MGSGSAADSLTTHPLGDRAGRYWVDQVRVEVHQRCVLIAGNVFPLQRLALTQPAVGLMAGLAHDVGTPSHTGHARAFTPSEFSTINQMASRVRPPTMLSSPLRVSHTLVRKAFAFEDQAPVLVRRTPTSTLLEVVPGTRARGSVAVRSSHPRSLAVGGKPRSCRPNAAARLVLEVFAGAVGLCSRGLQGGDACSRCWKP